MLYKSTGAFSSFEKAHFVLQWHFSPFARHQHQQAIRMQTTAPVLICWSAAGQPVFGRGLLRRRCQITNTGAAQDTRGRIRALIANSQSDAPG